MAILEQVNFFSLKFPADCAIQGVDGTIFIIRDSVLYARYPDSCHFEKISKVDTADGGVFIAFDNAGNLYYTGRWTGKLWRSKDYGKTFSLCLDLRQRGHFRGFAIDSYGAIYVGSYGWDGPAILFCSKDDGLSWFPLRCFQCRHIHDVAVNQYSGWLYVICGEKRNSYIEEANYIFRSKDGGVSFEPIVQPRDTTKGRRPLFLSMGFKNNICILSTDHAEGNNYLATFEDVGNATVDIYEQVLRLPEISFGNGRGKGYCWGFLYNKEKIYVICTGEYESILYSSVDGKNWNKEFSKCTSMGLSVEIGSYKDYAIISGNESAYLIKNRYLSNCCVESVYKPNPTLWKKLLLKHDLRYKKIFCSGYYWRSLDADEKAHMVFSLLAGYGIPKDGLIADVGCGIGPMILWGRCLGYHNICGIEANPRWLITTRRIYESCFKGETPMLRLVPRGKMKIPQIFNTLYHAILVIDVFVGDGHKLNLEESLRHCYDNLHDGGVLCFNVNPKTYEQSSPEFCLKIVSQLGMRKIRCLRYHDTNMISACK